MISKRWTALFAAMLLLAFAVPCLAQAALQLPASLTCIEDEAFMNSAAVSRVMLPEGTLEIGERAFAGSAAQEIILPKSLTAIADDAFDSCVVLAVRTTFRRASNQKRLWFRYWRDGEVYLTNVPEE